MSTADHYRHLIALGRDEFLTAAAAAVLVRYRGGPPLDPEIGTETLTLDEETADEPLPPTRPSMSSLELEVFPLVKKAGASFADRITIGRTPNNDIVVADHSVSRFHAYIRQHAAAWMVADAGSKNGSWLRGEPLEPRREKPLASRAVLRVGDVDLTFYLAADLFDVLGGVG